MADGRHEVLHEGAVLVVPGLVLDPRQLGRELGVVVTERHGAAPAPVPGLDDDGRLQGRSRAGPADDLGPRVREPGPAEEARGQKLVVGGEQEGRPVEHADAAGRENAERPEAVVDAVERRPHVEPTERGVAGAEPLERLDRSHGHELQTVETDGGECERGGCRLAGDDGDEHGGRSKVTRTADRKALLRTVTVRESATGGVGGRVKCLHMRLQRVIRARL